MSKIDGLPTSAEIQAVFFKAMRHGYATDAEKTTLAPLPKSKIISYEQYPWLVRDMFFVGSRGYSSGTTVIWFNARPVWSMNYRGCYPEAAIPTLKAALTENYTNDVWRAGRGPGKYYNGGDFVYFNLASEDASFMNFRGRELMNNKLGDEVGYHIFDGGCL